MRFPVDVVFLDGDGRVIQLLPALKHWRVSPLVPQAQQVLELAENAIKLWGLQVNQVLTLNQNN